MFGLRPLKCSARLIRPKNAKTFNDAVAAWLAWGKEEHYIS